MVGVVLRLDLLVEHSLTGRSTLVTQTRNAVNCVDSKAVAISAVADSQLEWSVDVALFPIATDHKILLALSAICQAVNQPGVRVEVEDARNIIREYCLPLVRLQTVRVLACIYELEEVDDVDETDLELWQVCAQESSGRECFVSRDISARSHNDIRFLALVIGGPPPDTHSFRAMLNSLLHGEEL